jgi:MYXO-CTERM domain-containing protein
MKNAIAVIFLLLLSPSAFSADINGVSYEFSGTEAIVTGRAPDSLEENIIIPQTVNFDGVNYVVTEIAAQAFFLADIVSISMPSTITAIGASAFEFNFRLVSANLPKNLTLLPERAFYAAGLTSVTIPDAVEIIGAEAFAGNELKSVTIGRSVEVIGEMGFYGNLDLKSVHFSGEYHANFADNRVFLNTPKLTNITACSSDSWADIALWNGEVFVPVTTISCEATSVPALPGYALLSLIGLLLLVVYRRTTLRLV